MRNTPALRICGPCACSISAWIWPRLTKARVVRSFASAASSKPSFSSAPAVAVRVRPACAMPDCSSWSAARARSRPASVRAPAFSRMASSACMSMS
ncbi:Uncharacterised protein [Bordetella pertussis]|nr:Uncharacterised protein [Bordetella pertussis]